MSRRALTLLVAGVAVVAAVVVSAVLPVPYVILSPGPTLNTLGTQSNGTPLIQISGHPVSHTTGHLNMVTVDFQGGPGDEVNIFTALRAWLSSHDAVVPQEEVFGTGESAQQVQNQDVEQMADSQEVATAAALTWLRIPFKTTTVVQQTEPGLPAASVLKAGDVITAVDGTPITDPTTLTPQIESRQAGTPLHLSVLRGGQARQVTITAVQRGGHPVIGIYAEEEYRFPFNVRISVGNIGGPSAGMMFALGIIDKLSSLDLTNGKFIAGTGEISQGGMVSPIGGIQQKMAGARGEGATVFLVPAGNCSDAAGADPAGLRLVKVSTLAGAVSALQALKTGGSVPSC
jgi:PDZ domain-containing protein